MTDRCECHGVLECPADPPAPEPRPPARTLIDEAVDRLQVAGDYIAADIIQAQTRALRNIFIIAGSVEQRGERFSQVKAQLIRMQVAAVGVVGGSQFDAAD